jgi:hypothetical protein
LKPIRILDVLKLATKARENGHVFNPLFTGDAGLGKSAISQSFVEVMKTTGFPEAGIEPDENFGFVDLRIAYMEAPDLIGFPKEIEDESSPNGYKTIHCLPEIWPTDPNSRGLLLIEEPNRGTTGVMNCLMQLLTDRKVHNYKLPEGWIIAACINPDSAEYDVNSMDAALRNRFEEYEINFDPISFLDYIEKSDWHESVRMFLNSGLWIFKDTKSIGNNPEAKYVSPRTWSKIDAAEQAGVSLDRRLHRETVCSILGNAVGKEYHKFRFDEAPVTAKDLLSAKTKALAKLREQSNPDNYKGDMIAVTVDSIIENYSKEIADNKAEGLVGEKTMAEVAKIIPSDQAVNLIKQCGFKQSKGVITSFFKEFVKRNPELTKVLKDNLKMSRTLKK